VTIASAPGKLILSGEYAVLDGGPALVLAINRRAIATRTKGPRGSSPFLAAVADELADRGLRDAAEIAMAIAVDSKAFYDSPRAGLAPIKLGLGSSAAVTVAAVALALGKIDDRERLFEIAAAAHARAQITARRHAEPERHSGSFAIPGAGASLVTELPDDAPKRPAATPAPTTQPIPKATSAEGTQPIGRFDPDELDEPNEPLRPRIPAATVRIPRSPRGSEPVIAQPPPWDGGSGADIAAAVHGGVMSYSRPPGSHGIVAKLSAPSVTMIPFHTGEVADTRLLVSQVANARLHNRAAVDAALTAIADASRAAIAACGTRQTALADQALIAALVLAARGMDALAAATGLPLVPPCVTQIRAALARFGGVAKTTGAGGGDVGIALIPRAEDATAATRSIIEAGCKPLVLAVDQTGVDLRQDAQ